MAVERHEYPRLGAWYQDLDYDRLDHQKDECFEITALDDEGKTIEVQYFNGEIDEMDIDTWFQHKLLAIAAPHDWSGPFDDVDKDLYPELANDEDLHPRHWENLPVEDIMDEEDKDKMNP